MIKNLPEVLPYDEQMRYLNLFKETGDLYYRNILVEHNLRLVRDIVKKNYFEDEEELFSIGVEGLIKAVDNFDLARGVKLSTFIYKCVRMELVEHFKYNSQAKRNGNVISLEETFRSSSDERGLTYNEVIADRRSNIEEINEIMILLSNVYDFLSKLNYRDKIMFEMTYGLNGYNETTQEKVALKVGVKQQYVSRRNRINLQRLKRYLHFLGYNVDRYENGRSLCRRRVSSY